MSLIVPLAALMLFIYIFVIVTTVALVNFLFMLLVIVFALLTDLWRMFVVTLSIGGVRTSLAINLQTILASFIFLKLVC